MIAVGEVGEFAAAHAVSVRAVRSVQWVDPRLFSGRLIGFIASDREWQLFFAQLLTSWAI